VYDENRQLKNVKSVLAIFTQVTDKLIDLNWHPNELFYQQN
jgi:hypothetical protein